MRSGLGIALIAIMTLVAPALAGTKQTRAPADAETVQSANRIFAEIDTNGDGRITRDEGIAYIAGRDVSHANRERIWSRLDTDRNGWVSRDEFVAQAIKYQKRMEIR